MLWNWNDQISHPRVYLLNILDTITKCRKEFDYDVIVVLSDSHPNLADLLNETANVRYAFCETGDAAERAVKDHAEEKALFLLAFGIDELGCIAARQVMRQGQKYYGSEQFAPLPLYHQLTLDAFNTMKEEHASSVGELGFKTFIPQDFANIMQGIDMTRHLEGAYIELGVYQGCSAKLALAYMRRKAIGRDCHFLDTYQAFDYEEARESNDMIWENLHFDVRSRDQVEQVLKPYEDHRIGLGVNVTINNIITDPLPDSVQRIAMVNIDVDIYEAIIAAMEKCAPLMPLGALAVLEDPGHTPAAIGSRLAAEDFLASPTGKQFTPIHMESGQTFLLKTREA